MAGKTTLNATNLEALGAERLAALLIELSTGDAAAKRRLRMALAAAQSPTDLAKEVRKRLATLARPRPFVEWSSIRALAADLDSQRRAIVDTVAKSDPDEALELMWRFMALAGPVFGNCDDSNGTVGSVFDQACADLGTLAGKASAGPEALADQVFTALVANGYGQFDGLIAITAPALGQRGLAQLKRRIAALASQSVERPAAKDRKALGWSSSGPIYADEMAERARLTTVRLALRDIADVEGDADAFIAQYDEATRKVPKIAAEIARRLLKAGRAEKALAAINAAEHRDRAWLDFDWEDARIDTLDALGRGEDAQCARWTCFERSLSPEHLRAYLKRLPDFDDVEAEATALAHAEGFRNRLAGLRFLVSWPALDHAARLVIAHAGDLDGGQYQILSPAAEALAARHKLAATLVLRAMIDFALGKARTSRYRHAARHLQDCAGLASGIADFGAFETHAAYEQRLRRQYPRTQAFWSLMA